MPVLLGLLLAPARADQSPVRPVQVPFELLPTRHMALSIRVNGKGPYRVIFDTGSPVVLLNDKIGRECGLLPKEGVAPPFGLFGGIGQVSVPVLEVGGVRTEKVPAVVMDHPTIQAASEALGGVDGILGFPFFARYRMTIDYESRTLSFVPNGYEPKDVLKGLVSMLLSRERPPEPVVLAPAAIWGLRLVKEPDDKADGVTIGAVLAGSAAAKSGLRAGDRLLSLDGRWTDTLSDGHRAAEKIPPGKPVPAVIRRGGKEVTIEVTPRKGF